MDRGDELKLRADLLREIEAGARRVAILGDGLVGRRLYQVCRRRGLSADQVGLFTQQQAEGAGPLPPARALAQLAGWPADVVCVAVDADKEDVLRAALPFLVGAPRVLVGGYRHFGFRDELFERELAQLLPPSIANGYPNCLVHLYECLRNAARLGLRGDVVEFGTFRGGTSMFLARVARALGQTWRVVTFDSFGGFPARRSPLDMYDHPGAVFTDAAAVRRYFQPWLIDLVEGDIVETAQTLAGRPTVLSFIDTDNYSSAKAALEVVKETTVPNGAIVLDHFTGVRRFRYTLGERMAAQEILLGDPRFFNLHGTGVFLRQVWDGFDL
ncbi:MAG: TylF/MycF/NovP-related O-methyltransferase [Actinomycetales bacterium]